MKRSVICAAALAGLLAIGCDDEKEAATPALDNAAEKAGDQASKAMNKVSDAAKDGTDVMKDAATNSADAVQKTIDDLIAKTKTAVEEKKFTEAEGYIKQIQEWKSKLPAAAQARVDTALAEVSKLVAAGKSLMPPAAH